MAKSLPNAAVKLTVEPSSTSVPAATDCLNIVPGFASSEYTGSSAFDTSFSEASTSSACVCVMPIKLGTDTRFAGLSDPFETVIPMELPAFASDFAFTLWLMTAPATTVSLASSVSVPTANPASLMTRSASSFVMPTTFGTVLVAFFLSFTCSFFALSSSVLVEVLLQLHPTRPNAPKAISAAMQIAAIRRARFSANALALSFSPCMLNPLM